MKQDRRILQEVGHERILRGIHPRTVNISGMKFGMLTVREMLEERTSYGEIRWICDCSCGGEIVAVGSKIRSGRVTDCGCITTHRPVRAQPPLDGIGAIDWARLAAFIDGEGCIRIQRSKPRRGSPRHQYIVRIQITNTDARLMQWVQVRFGGAVTPPVNKGNGWKPMMIWYISAKRADPILRGIRPYLILKNNQCDAALALRNTICHSCRYPSDEEMSEKLILFTKVSKLNKKGVA
jgi:hypothetical protein